MRASCWRICCASRARAIHAARNPGSALNRNRAGFWGAVKDELESDAIPLKPQRVIAAVNKRLPEPSIILSDAGTPTPYATRFLRLNGQGSSLVIPRAFGGLGYAIPAVVAAWLARPVGLFGDGSFGMAAGELETLVRLQVPAVLIPLQQCLLRLDQGASACPCAAGRQRGVRLGRLQPGRHAARGRGFRCRRVPRRDAGGTGNSAGRGLRDLGAEGPSFVDVAVESIGDVIPPVYRWLQKTGKDPMALAAAE